MNATASPAASRDPLAIGLGALGCGVATGAACVTLALLVVAIADLADARGDVLIGGLAFGIAVATLTSWRLSRPLDNLWQRGVVSILSVFGALAVAFILTIPARRALGLMGLVLLAAVLLIGALASARWAIRGRGPRDDPSAAGE